MSSVAVALAHHGKMVHPEAFGWANKERRVRATPTRAYAVGSVAKAVIGAAVHELVRRGTIRLDDTPEQHRGNAPELLQPEPAPLSRLPSNH